MKSALVLGGTGQIGRAVARRLAEAGWEVTVAGRDPAHVPAELEESGVRFVRVDRERDDELRTAIGGGTDVLVDVIPYTEQDARQLLSLASAFGSLVAISSASVYRDDAGRTLDEVTSAEEAPRYPIPISEDQPTVEPGGTTYSTRKVAMEQLLLGADGPAATVIRPGAVHGPGSPLPREWHFVKRMLDGRRAVILPARGETVFHTTSARNLAELVRLAATRPGRRVLNCGDPDPPDALRISRAIARALDHEWVEVTLPGPAAWGSVGDHPWLAPEPFVLDMTRAELELGYRPVVTYADAVPETCEWLVEATRDRDWRDVFPAAAEHLAASFDYAAEDAFLAGLSGSSAAD